MKYSVSIIMSVYNEDIAFIRSALKSIQQQTLRDIQIVVVLDDPENIEAETYLKQESKFDDRIVFIINSRNRGLAYSLNKALEKCNSDLIARMDADDISYPDRIEKQFKFLNTNPDISLVGSAIEVIDENSLSLYTRSLPSNSDLLKSIVRYKAIAYHPTWMVRKEVYDLLKGYKEYKKAQDFDFLNRAVAKNIKISNLSDILLKYRTYSERLTVEKLAFRIKNHNNISGASTNTLDEKLTWNELIAFKFYLNYKKSKSLLYLPLSLFFSAEIGRHLVGNIKARIIIRLNEFK
jgi:glycosyltransferase involved in cell wall biosynthesis